MASGTEKNYKRVEGKNRTTAATLAFAGIDFIPPWAEFVELMMASDGAKYAFCPQIRKVWFFDDSAGTYRDDTDLATDDDNTTEVVLNDMEADVDFLYVGCDVPFRGLAIDVDAANGTASVVTWEYWDGSAWADTSDTDGTASGGATFAVDGLVTWTLPSDWATTKVNGHELFWVRASVSATLDAATDLDQITALHRNANYAQHLGTSPLPLPIDRSAVQAIELIATGNTPVVHYKFHGS